MTLIEFNETQGIFHLHNSKISYLISVEEGGLLSHLYFGKKVKDYHGQMRYPRVDRGFSGNLPGTFDRTYSPDTLPREFSSAGEMDYRTPAVLVRQENGANALALRYKSYQISAGKPSLPGLPATFVQNDNEAQTLTITLADEVTGIEVDLLYTIFANQAVIARSSKLRNESDQTIYVEKLASLEMDFVDKDFDVICLPGAHANERHLERGAVNFGKQSFASLRGSSSHHMNPFIALVDKKTDEFQGEAYGFALVYSGNHNFEVEKDQLAQVRLVAGINDFNFSWKLVAGESFQAPEILLAYSDTGLNQMSQAFHKTIHNNLVRSKFKNEERPILVNNWEATYFDYDEEKLKPIVDEAKDMGIEMFVLDDGWFGHRDDDNSSLGDWKVYQKKFPQGIGHFADYVHAQGLKFGLWVEPEMVSFDSDLYQQHPDYLMQVPGRAPSPSRNQYLLDMGREEVRQNIYDQLVKVFKEAKVDYIKWDMNRNMSDVFASDLPSDQQGQVYHRYILGVYKLMEDLTAEFPNILFEGCSGGGGRFDAGWAYYMPQIWASDNTDAIARQTIQYGTSLVYPVSMTTAHVSAIPNHQTGRKTPFDTRGAIAMSGVFGYELDLTKMSQADKDQVKVQVKQYQAIRSLVQFGDFYRLKSPSEGNQTAWNFVSADKKEAVLVTAQVLAYAQPYLTKTKLAGLDPDKYYQDQETKVIYGGDELMNLGFYDPVVHEDYTAKMYHFKAID
ncbi:alpha-galactosidase [Ligilactobacillus equi]|uniref:Alpha-galactosidase n=2 Tax=Ligilactobacillus equi TaxID=137357 RepID=A0A0R1TRH2_9LACO|nr:alpha-galactosidase [Ligilactobacillus equi]KRL81026.1 alpha-galactosidase [Ligilactobacillus equi DSM 15833 = JCM 10991]